TSIPHNISNTLSLHDALPILSLEMMVLAVTTGSIAFSHVNDPGFWLFKEYFNLSVAQTIKVRTTYTTALSVLGLIGVYILNIFRSEEHTSELQSRFDLVCRLL